MTQVVFWKILQRRYQVYVCIQIEKNRKHYKFWEDEKELIAHLQNIWPDVDTWWKGNKVQNVIKKIITQFSDNPKANFLRDMKYKIIEKLN